MVWQAGAEWCLLHKWPACLSIVIKTTSRPRLTGGSRVSIIFVFTLHLFRITVLSSGMSSIERCEVSEELSASFFTIEEDIGGSSWAVSTNYVVSYPRTAILFPHCYKYYVLSGLGSSWRHAPCGYWSPGGWSSSVRVAWGLLSPVQQPCSQGEVKVELGSSSDKMVRTSKRQCSWTCKWPQVIANHDWGQSSSVVSTIASELNTKPGPWSNRTLCSTLTYYTDILGL